MGRASNRTAVAAATTVAGHRRDSRRYSDIEHHPPLGWPDGTAAQQRKWAQEQERALRSRAIDSLQYGRIHAQHARGCAAALKDFGYLGLGLTEHHSPLERDITHQAIGELYCDHPADMRVVDTPDGKRLLVRAFAEDGVTVTAAFEVAARYARLVGV